MGLQEMILGTTVATIAVEILVIETVGATTTAAIILVDSKVMLIQLSPIQDLQLYLRATTVYNRRHQQLQLLLIRRHPLTEWVSHLSLAHMSLMIRFP